MTSHLVSSAGLPEIARPERASGATKMLPGPRVRLGLGVAATVVTAMLVRKRQVGRCETTVFRAVNGLPDSLYRPAWGIMQFGTLGAAPASAGMAWLAHDRELARRLLAGGTTAWALSKVVKRMVRRPRPAKLVAGTRCRGAEAAGLGYLSGHAGVAAALGAAAVPHLRPAGRAVVLAAVPAVGLTRMYVGAHLPLDVAGGAALGLAVEAAVSLLTELPRPARAGSRPGPRRRRRSHPGMSWQTPFIVSAGHDGRQRRG